MILIVGATGYLGGIIARRLLQNGEKVRILVRPQSDYAQLVAAGAEAVIGDLKEPESLRSACEGATVVLTTANSAQRGGEDNAETVEMRGNQNLIEAAQAAGVQRFLFVSALGADTSHPVPFLRGKAETEERLRASGMTFTILAPHIFMDVWIPMVVGSAIKEARPAFLMGPGERKHSFIAVDDVAAFAVAALKGETARDTKLVLGGPEAISWRQIIALAEQIVGRPIGLQTPAAGGPLPPLPEVVLGLLQGMEMSDVVVPMGETARAFGVQQTRAEQFLRRMLA